MVFSGGPTEDSCPPFGSEAFVFRKARHPSDPTSLGHLPAGRREEQEGRGGAYTTKTKTLLRGRRRVVVPGVVSIFVGRQSVWLGRLRSYASTIGTMSWARNSTWT